MKKAVTAKASLKIHYPIEALGVEHANPGQIRVEKLSERLKPKVDFPHRHDFYQLTFVVKGNGWHEIDFVKHKISGRQIFFMKPGQVHSWVFAKGAEGFVIEFTRESLPSLSAKSLLLLKLISSIQDATIFKNEELWKSFETNCKLMISEFTQKSEHFEISLEGLLQSLLAPLLRVSEVGAQHNTSTLVEKFKQLVEENFQAEQQVLFYAQKLNMTPKALTMQIRRSLKKAPRTVLQERVLLEAKRLLSYSDMSVAEVGYELGFDDANYFTRFFTKAAKISPSNFRDKVKALT